MEIGGLPDNDDDSFLVEEDVQKYLDIFFGQLVVWKNELKTTQASYDRLVLSTSSGVRNKISYLPVGVFAEENPQYLTTVRLPICRSVLSLAETLTVTQRVQFQSWLLHVASFYMENFDVDTIALAHQIYKDILVSLFKNFHLQGRDKIDIDDPFAEDVISALGHFIVEFIYHCGCDLPLDEVD